VIAAYLGSLAAWALGRSDARYFDSVNLFLTLMLLGRFLQERALLKQRRELLQADSFAHATCTVLEPQPHQAAWPRLEAGHRVLLHPGSLRRCEAVLEEAPAWEWDLASLNGERQPVLLNAGAAVPAGARLLSARPCRLLSKAPFKASLLAGLLPNGA